MTSDLPARLADAHRRAQMVGWDFAALAGRMQSASPSWSFDDDCLATLTKAAGDGRTPRALDLGTGGGERVLALWRRLAEAGIDASLTATEGWAPNLAVARAALSGLGARVHEYDAETDGRLPFGDATFEVVMCCHEAVDIAEVARVLTPGGVLLNQQVAGSNAPELRSWFATSVQYPQVRLDVDVQRCREAGLDVFAADEWSGPMTFTDAEALVSYLAYVPWEVPGFRVADHVETLVALDAQAPITLTERRFRVYARKPLRDSR